MSTGSILSILAYPQYGYHMVCHTGLSLVHCSYLSVGSLHPYIEGNPSTAFAARLIPQYESHIRVTKETIQFVVTLTKEIPYSNRVTKKRTPKLSQHVYHQGTVIRYVVAEESARKARIQARRRAYDNVLLKIRVRQAMSEAPGLVRELDLDSEYSAAVGLPPARETSESPDHRDKKDENDSRVISA